MSADLLLSIGHHLSVYFLVSCMVAEWVILNGSIDVGAVMRLAKIDLTFGIAAAIVIAAGVCRIYFGAKGPSFYFHSPFFWVKMALFVTVGLISILPTIQFVRWNARIRRDPLDLPTSAALATPKRALAFEFLFLLFIPVSAAMMARGVGY